MVKNYEGNLAVADTVCEQREHSVTVAKHQNQRQPILSSSGAAAPAVSDLQFVVILRHLVARKVPAAGFSFYLFFIFLRFTFYYISINLLTESYFFINILKLFLLCNF